MGDVQTTFDELHEPTDAALNDASRTTPEPRRHRRRDRRARPACPGRRGREYRRHRRTRPALVRDLLVDDAATAWRILCALPAARTASRRGVELSTGSSLLGAVLLLASIPFQGTEPLTGGGAACGLWIGHCLARRTLDHPWPNTSASTLTSDDAHRTLRDRVRQAERFAVALPGIGRVPIPAPGTWPHWPFSSPCRSSSGPSPWRSSPGTSSPPPVVGPARTPSPIGELLVGRCVGHRPVVLD
jgi:H+-transporting ATPase